MSLLFVEDTHQYFLNGSEIPSVSSVIDSVLGTIFDTVPPSMHHAVEMAQKFGRAVHTGIKFKLQNQLDWSTVDDEIRPCIESAMAFVDHFDIKFRAEDIERPLASKKYCFGGTPDLRGYLRDNGSRVIVDWKTASAIDKDRCEYQLNAYDILDSEETLRDTKCVKYVVQLIFGGGYRVYPCCNVLYKRKFLEALKRRG